MNLVKPLIVPGKMGWIKLSIRKVLPLLTDDFGSDHASKQVIKINFLHLTTPWIGGNAEIWVRLTITFFC